MIGGDLWKFIQSNAKLFSISTTIVLDWRISLASTTFSRNVTENRTNCLPKSSRWREQWK